jgi:hypothetical protein
MRFVMADSFTGFVRIAGGSAARRLFPAPCIAPEDLLAVAREPLLDLLEVGVALGVDRRRHRLDALAALLVFAGLAQVAAVAGSAVHRLA